MDKGRGVFIVIEGTDGSGKGTQFQLLQERLKNEGYDVATFDFPQYDQPSSYFVRQYLNGRYGGLDEVGPYTSSLFYALDRYEAAPKIREALEQGKVVLSNRFTGSSMGHQGTKFHNAEERRGYFIWLDNLEFEMLHIPRPDMSFVLRVPADIAQSLVDQKEKRSYTDKKRDLHEADINHLQHAVAVFDDLTQLFPKDFQRIDCVRDNQLMSVETIQELIWQKVRPMLPEPGAKPQAVAVAPAPATSQQPGPIQKDPAGNYAYYIPEALSAEIRDKYRQQLNAILDRYNEMVQLLSAYIAENSAGTKGLQEALSSTIQAQAAMALRPVLPVALTYEPTAIATPKTAQLAKEHLPGNHADETKPVDLVDVWPRNEIDLVPSMLYEHSNLPVRTLREEVRPWPYERKVDIFSTYLGECLNQPAMPEGTLDRVHYRWDILSSYDTFYEFQSVRGESSVEWQQLTPRFGYDVPRLIEEADLSDRFDECFDLSLELYSLLQKAGFPVEAQCATLYGHKLRWQSGMTARQAFTLQAQPKDHIGLRTLLQQMQEKLSEAHPILGEALQFVEALEHKK